MAKRTSTEKQLQVLALIARGDTYQDISNQLGMPIPTIADIKKRNTTALEVMQSKMIQHKITTNRKLLSKAQGLIETKLDRVAKSDELRQSALERFRNGDISYEDYAQETLGLVDASLTELNAVAKEAFNQSQIEQGKPTSIAGGASAAEAELLALAEAIKSGDEVVLERLVFNSPHETNLIEGQTV